MIQSWKWKGSDVAGRRTGGGLIFCIGQAWEVSWIITQNGMVVVGVRTFNLYWDWLEWWKMIA